MASKKRKATAKKRTGWSVASAAGKLLRQIEDGAKVRLVIIASDGYEAEGDITDRVERICASALGQRETKR